MGEPSFIIIGAMRSGTTALYSDICQHSKATRAFKKELNYYWRWYGDKENYLSKFPPDGWISGEASPAYMLCSEFCAERIYNDFPNIKIIAILRNPVDRLWSHWWHTKKHEELTFPAALSAEQHRLNALEKTDFRYLQRSYFKQGQYYNALKPYYQRFENILVLQTEKFFKERQSAMTRVFSFLGLDPELVPDVPFRESTYPEVLDENTRLFLHYHYVKDNELLFNMIGERFDW
jgi:hypothetical protein